MDQMHQELLQQGRQIDRLLEILNQKEQKPSAPAPICTAEIRAVGSFDQKRVPVIGTAVVPFNLFSVVTKPLDACLQAEVRVTASYLDANDVLVCSGVVENVATQTSLTENINLEIRPWNLREFVRWTNEPPQTNSGAKRVYTAANTNAGDLAKLPKYEMQCVDCHNRPAHTFELPERALNREMQFGGIPVTLPFIKKKGTEALNAEYKTSEEAARRIPEAIKSFYATSYPALSKSRAADIEQAANTVLAVYNRNVFPELKVSWGTYPNNLGHTDFPGCFRCHDGEHSSSDQNTISQDCGICHETVSVSETSPEILKTLGLADRIAGIQKK
jgi:hypothetical protein